MLRATAPDIAKQTLCCHHIRGNAAHFGIGKELIKCALELANICLDVLSKVFHGVALKCHASEARFGLDDRAARLKVWHLDVDCHPPFKATAQALRQGRNTVWWFVATDDNLLVGLVKGIEGVKELLLSFLAPGNKLHIVDDQYIDIAIPVRKACLFEADRLDKLFDKRFRAQVSDFFAWVAREDLVTHRLDEVCLTEAHATVDEEGVILRTRAMCDCLAGGVGEVVARADDEILEGIARVEACRWCRRTRMRRGSWLADECCRSFLDAVGWLASGFAANHSAFFALFVYYIGDARHLHTTVLERFFDNAIIAHLKLTNRKDIRHTNGDHPVFITEHLGIGKPRRKNAAWYRHFNLTQNTLPQAVVHWLLLLLVCYTMTLFSIRKNRLFHNREKYNNGVNPKRATGVRFFHKNVLPLLKCG